MFLNMLSKVFGTANDRALKSLQKIVDQVNDFENKTMSLSDEQLKAKTDEFRKQLALGKTLDDILPEAYAVVREATKRTLGMRHFDVQILGGIVLHQGKVAEMKTGEGKTITAVLPLYLNALEGKGAHLVTVNDYLSKRDAEWNRPVYEFLGLTLGILTNDMRDEDRKKQYNSDILYATNNELGFDYLRDNMKFRYQNYVQREMNFAIVDECDSILIDEARTPLIISGAAQRSSDFYVTAQKIVVNLKKNIDFEVDEKMKSVQLTESGYTLVEQQLGIDNLYEIQNINMLHHIMKALKANAIFARDVDYLVRDNKVLIVDEFTGRVLSGRRYSDGLHQAIEAKEGVTIEQESQTLASITLQNFFRMYKKLAGMTGTAVTEAEEFMKIYGLDVIVIPTNQPMIRMDKDDIIFLSERSKFKKIAEDVIARHKKGQPVLIGTVAVEKSEKLSAVLQKVGIPHEVLNAKNHAREAEIIAQAGKLSSVTIATNMAGRGTDIKLTSESLAAGGLYVLGTERHESRRIDNQLRGRSGRQGDAGESRFYISLEDDLIRIFAGDNNKMKQYMERFGMAEDEEIESKMVSRLIETSQEKVEKHNFETRKHLIEYDDVLNQHRNVIYAMRQDILKDIDQIRAIAADFIKAAVHDLIGLVVVGETIQQGQALQIIEMAAHLINVEQSLFNSIDVTIKSVVVLEQSIVEILLLRYNLLRNQSEMLEGLQSAEKWLMLETIDGAWKQHMINIDQLKEGIGLRGWGQKNPLIEYKREAFAMFSDMMKQIRADVVHRIFHLKPEHFNARQLEAQREKEMDAISMSSGSSEEVKSQITVRREDDKVGRNEICSCGSGKKYKKCCG
jgi:preprotein translocase subunit SecA